MVELHALHSLLKHETVTRVDNGVYMIEENLNLTSLRERLHQYNFSMYYKMNNEKWELTRTLFEVLIPFIFVC